MSRIVPAVKFASIDNSQSEAILAKATQVFAQYGFAAAPMSELAERCGVSKALLYHYYASKDAILFAMLDRYTRRLIELCETTERRGFPPRQCFAELVRAFLIEYQTSQQVHRVLLHDVAYLGDKQHKQIVKQQNRVVDYFRDVIRAAFGQNLRHEHLTAATMMVFGMINWTFTWLRPDGPLSYEAFAQAVVKVSESGIASLGAPTPAAKKGSR